MISQGDKEMMDKMLSNMLQEAEKYLGYPYVWGGSNPDESFDCSGFVCYAINNCGNDWNIGRINSKDLLKLCTPITREEAKKGDLIFFQGTYDTVGASHVGFYVGNSMMLHCGNPIQYESIDTEHWRSHFLTFGRLKLLP